MLFMKNSLFAKKLFAVLLAFALIMTITGNLAIANSSGATQENLLQILDEKELQQVQELRKAIEVEESVRCTGGIWVTVRILGYDDGDGGVILNNYKVKLTDNTGYTALDALEEACQHNNISLTVSGSGEFAYVTEIGGQQAGYFQPNNLYYSGWMYRVWPAEDQPETPQNDELPSVGAGTYTLESGDKVTWYYAIPTETWYTIMSNYKDIKLLYFRGQTINVNVKGQKYEDLWTWNLLPFAELSGVEVTLNRASDGAELASAETDDSGNAIIIVPRVRIPTLCYISVKEKYFGSGNISGGIEQTASWRKPIIIVH
jgi:preprotein translocase subunit YajC